jgi:hypothetical protein
MITLGLPQTLLSRFGDEAGGSVNAQVGQRQIRSTYRYTHMHLHAESPGGEFKDLSPRIDLHLGRVFQHPFEIWDS